MKNKSQYKVKEPTKLAQMYYICVNNKVVEGPLTMIEIFQKMRNYGRNTIYKILPSKLLKTSQTGKKKLLQVIQNKAEDIGVSLKNIQVDKKTEKAIASEINALKDVSKQSLIRRNLA